MHSITVRHNFEAAHRLPHLGGKCQNIHGHSWWAEVTVSAPALTTDHTVVEFGTFKKDLRKWIDAKLDHGTMLGVADNLLQAFEADGSKVFVFGRTWMGADWPTVEAVAALLADKASAWVQAKRADMPPGAYVSRVRVSETHVNAAEWVADPKPLGGLFRPGDASVGGSWAVPTGRPAMEVKHFSPTEAW